MTATGQLAWWGATDPGQSRENNEDAWQVEDSLHAAILADGMGGANCGEVGSAMTVAGSSNICGAGGALSTPRRSRRRRSAPRIAKVRRGQRADRVNGMGSTVVLALWRRRTW